MASEHEDHEHQDEPLILPILIDEIESRRDLFEEVAEFLGGVLLDVTSGSYGQAVTGYDDPELRAVVQTGLEVTRPHATTRIEIAFQDDLVDARLLEDGTEAVPTAADVELLALARALFDRRLETSELALLLYSEFALDLFAQGATLRVLTGFGRMPGLRFGAARTLVPVIQARELSIDRHCQYNRGIRYSLTGTRLVRRHPPRHLHDVTRKLAAVRDEPLVLFLGAGFSSSSDVPMGNRLRDDAIRGLLSIDQEDPRDSLALAREFFNWARDGDHLSAREQELGREEFAATLTLEQVLRIERQSLDVALPPTLQVFIEGHNQRLADGGPLGGAVYSLRRMAQARRRLVIATVNFDELIEHEDAAPYDIAVTDDQFATITPILEAMRRGVAHPEGRTPLLKLHGTIREPQSCIATDDLTRFGASPAKREAMLALVRGDDDARPVPWVYVGASLRDVDLDTVFSLPEFNLFADEYWVMPSPSESVRDFVLKKERRWGGRELDDALFKRTVTETADAFMNALAEDWAGQSHAE